MRHDPSRDDSRTEPPWIPELRSAVASLRRAASTGFPDLSTRPANDEDVVQVVRSSIAWCRKLCEPYGYGQRRTRSSHPPGVLSFFDDSSISNTAEALHLIGERPYAFLVSPTEFFDEELSYLGETVQPAFSYLKNADDRATPFTRSNWDEVRRRLERAHHKAASIALDLADWVTRRLDDALMPSITKVGEEPNNRIVVRVAQRDWSRQVTLRLSAARFLAALAKEGVATVGRSTKQRLVGAIPELSPWIEVAEPPPTQTSRREDHQSAYQLAPEIGQRVDLGEL